MKVVSLDKLHNFYIGRIWSVQVKFGERGKSSGRAMEVEGLTRDFDHALTKGWPKVDH
jgi:hypothetical protein